jgi:hypothetical protein
MQHEVEIALEVEHDSLSEATETENTAPLRLRERRIDRAQKKRAREPDADERLSHDARLERGEIGDDVRQLGHGRSLATGSGRDNQLSLRRSRII